MTVRGYQAAPFNAWSGWRLRDPGGPIGGQYHGFIAPDSAGWPAGRAEIYRPGDTRGLGAVPGNWPRQAGSGSSLGPWSNDWGGTALMEGETHSDHIYRSPAEIRPRANASGGAHVIRSLQTRRSAGYAVAPGNYRYISGMGGVSDYSGKSFAHLMAMAASDPNISSSQQMTQSWRAQGIPFQNIITTDGKSVAIRISTPAPAPVNTVSVPTPMPIVQFPAAVPAVGATATVLQPPPQQQPVSAPAVSVYSAPPVSPSPAPTVAATPANFLPSQGLVVPGITPGATTTTPAGAAAPLDLSAWLSSSTIIPNIANQWVVLGGIAAAFFLFSGKGRR